MTGHLDIDTLADLAEGLLDAERAAAARAHLAECGQCGERQAELADVSMLLAAVAPPPMPDGLAERIDAALAAEREHTSAYAAEPEGLRVAIDSPRRLRRLQVLSAAAAAVVVVGGGYAVTRISGSVSPSDGRAAVPDVSDSGPRAQSAPHADSRLGVRTVATHATYQDATLAAQVAAAMRAPAITGRATCLPSGRTAVVVDVGAHYGGETVTVLVLRSSAAGRVDVLIAGPGCTDLKLTSEPTG